VITHALLRNTLFPMLFLAYYWNHNKNGEYDTYYWGLYVLSLVSMCIYFGFAVIGYNPLNNLIPSTWRDPYSPLQYLVYITIIARVAEHRTHDIGYAYTLAATSAGAAGYLYEVPRWLQWGLWDIIRTARTSLIVVDWGMMCVPLMVGLVLWKKPNLANTGFLISLGLYEAYCIAYYYNSTAMIHILHQLFLPIPKTFFLRIPAMLLCGYYVNTLRKKC
jgi:hypothetical protein